MAIPKVYFGSNSDGRLLAVGQGNQDGGVNYDILVKSASIYPAGQGGEAIFKYLYLTLTWTMGVTLKVTPFLDGWKRSELTQDIVLPAVTERTVQTFELSLKQPFYGSYSAIAGSVSVNKYSKIVTGSLTSFTTALSVGDLVLFGSGNGVRVDRAYKIASIQSNTQLTLVDYYAHDSISNKILSKNPVPYSQTHLRGSELAIQIETENGLAAGDLVLEAAEVDVTVVREAQEAY